MHFANAYEPIYDRLAGRYNSTNESQSLKAYACIDFRLDLLDTFTFVNDEHLSNAFSSIDSILSFILTFVSKSHPQNVYLFIIVIL